MLILLFRNYYEREIIMNNNLDEAILYLCHDLNRTLKKKNWKQLSEKSLLFELTISILGSQCTYELALAATEELDKSGLFVNPVAIYSKHEYFNLVYSTLSKPIYRKEWGVQGRRYRFYESRSNYITESIWNVYNNYGSIKKLISSLSELNNVRETLIRLIKGFGPKQASHFLRNIGYAENIAVLDTHVLDYMHIKGMVDKPLKSISNLKLYEKVETILRELINIFNYTLACIDQAIWIVMRVYSRESYL